MTLLEISIDLQNEIENHVTDVSIFNNEKYTEYRKLLVTTEEIKDFIPAFITSNRSVEQLNRFFRSNFKSYQERRNNIEQEFSKLLDYLEFGTIHSSQNQELNKIFISYSVKDKEIAGKVKNILSKFNISAFLAHEDIEVSEEWEKRILEEIKTSSIFICLLSENFIHSDYCIQETGIAAIIKNMHVIPLSIDGSIPIGFIKKYQSTKVNAETLGIFDLLPALLKNESGIGISISLELFEYIRGYRNAEVLTNIFLPHLSKLNQKEIKRLVNACKNNDQIYDASGCATSFLPQLMKNFGSIMSVDGKDFFNKKIDQYS
jgi:hypothetical protein